VWVWSCHLSGRYTFQTLQKWAKHTWRTSGEQTRAQREQRCSLIKDVRTGVSGVRAGSTAMPAPVNRRSAYASTVSTGLNVLDLSGQYTRQATEVPRTDQRHHGFEENELAEAVLVSLDQPLRQVGTQRPQVGAPLLGMK